MRKEPHVSSEAANNSAIRLTEQQDVEARPLMIWGLIPLVPKIPTRATGGALFAFEHTDMGKGGPPRHVHHDQDEYFYVVDGEFVMEVGDQRHHLKRGDCLFAPRRVPHAWACVSERGSLLTTVSPAGTFETFILETTKHATLPPPAEVAAAFAEHGMTLLGPPLAVE